MSEAFKQFIELIQENKSFTFIVLTSFIIAMFFSLAVIFYKIRQKPWKALIPIYNQMALMDILDIPIWMFLVMVIPFVNIVGIPFIVVLTGWKLGAYCRKGTFMRLGLILCPPLFYPLLAASYIDLDGTGRYVVEPVKVNTSFSLEAVEVNDISNELGALSLGNTEVIDRIAPIMATRKIEVPKDSVTVKKDFNEVEAMSSANEVEDLKRVLPTADDLTFDYNSLYKDAIKPKEEKVEVPTEEVEKKPDFELAAATDESTIDYNELYKDEVVEKKEEKVEDEVKEDLLKPIEEEPKIIIHDVALEAAEPVTDKMGPIPINKRYDLQSEKKDIKAVEVAAIHDIEAKDEPVEENKPLPNPFENMEEEPPADETLEQAANSEVVVESGVVEELDTEIPEINPMAPPVIAPFDLPVKEDNMEETVSYVPEVVEQVPQPVVEAAPQTLDPVLPVNQEPVTSFQSQTPVTEPIPEMIPSVVLAQVVPEQSIQPSIVGEVKVAPVPPAVIPEIVPSIPESTISSTPVEPQQQPIPEMNVSPVIEPIVPTQVVEQNMEQSPAMPIEQPVVATETVPSVPESVVSNTPVIESTPQVIQEVVPVQENNTTLEQNAPQNGVNNSLDLPMQAASPFGPDGMPGLAEVPDLSLPNVNAVPEIDVPEINLTEQAMQGMRERTTIEPGTRVDQIVSMNIAEPDQLPVGVLMKPQPVAPPPAPIPQALAPQVEMTRAEAMGIRQNFFTDVVPNSPKMGETFQQPPMNNFQQPNPPVMQQGMPMNNPPMMQPMPMNQMPMGQPIMNGNGISPMNYSPPMTNNFQSPIPTVMQQGMPMNNPPMMQSMPMNQMPMGQPMMNGNGVNPMDPTSIFQVNSGNGPLLRPMENNAPVAEKICPVCGVKLKPDCPICIMCGFKF